MKPIVIENCDNFDWIKYAMESGHEIIEIDPTEILAGRSINPLSEEGVEIELTVSDMVDNFGNIIPYSGIKKNITYDQWEKAAEILKAIKERLDGDILNKKVSEGTREIYNYPLHSMSGVVMMLTEKNAIFDPFFTRHEESIQG